MFSYTVKLGSFNCNPFKLVNESVIDKNFLESLNIKVCTRVDLLFPGQRRIRDIPPQRTSPVVIL